MQDDLERLIERSLDRRSSDLSIRDGSIDDVLSRVEGRGRRRRTIAVAGSLAIVTAGLVGITSLQGRDAPSGTPFDAAPDTAPATVLVEGYQDAYRCTAPLDVATAPDDDGQYFAVCDSVLLNDGVPIEVVPTTMVEGTLPSIGFCEEVTSDGMLVSIPCPTSPMTVVPTTVAPSDVLVTTTTTTIVCEAIDGGATVSVPCNPASPVAAFEQQHLVGAGDSLASIAARYGVDLDILVSYNAWADGRDHLLLVGDVVLIPPGATVPTITFDEQSYVVQEADNPARIADLFGITVDQLAAYNVGNDDYETFLIGGTILIPPGANDRTG